MDDEALELEIDADRRSCGPARRAVGAWLAARAFPDEHASDWLVIVSEVVTNAVIHARTPARIVVRWNGQRVRLEVFDGSAQLVPRTLEAAPGVGGRGLFLVDQLSTAWGYETHADGKCVWATLETTQ